MAKSVTTWYCETCNKDYEREEDAIRCEELHYKLQDIEFVQYSPGKRCPDSICINVDIGGDIKQVFYRVVPSCWGDK